MFCFLANSLAAVRRFSLYGSQCAAYLFGPRAVRPYLVVFTGLCIFGALMPLTLAWRVSELLNMLMAVPNLLALLLLSRRYPPGG